ncbi:ribose-5-phosphate isomerase RpiA [Candidatus Acetothermia bacterium]|nr:ribose-5-phosphate isomerase RpiA [Candidatus Acetothermia bacterium]MBI3643331.1 ribose-5-phosphate isomerase RpiA [Candidatus Acetothermia bacterium]
MDLKALAAERALRYVTNEVKALGLGTGSTAEKFLDRLSLGIQSGQFKNLVGVPTSLRTQEYAKRLKIPLATLDEVESIDLTIDGADEVDPRLNLIKGHGGALTREKTVARASRQLIIIIDDSKRVDRLGTGLALPVEVLPFGWTQVQRSLINLGFTPVLRLGGDKKPFMTDQNNYILDCSFANGISSPQKVDRALNDLTGVVEHGLFLGMADRVVVASAKSVEVLERE